MENLLKKDEAGFFLTSPAPHKQRGGARRKNP
jgi:hypothetical protein